MGKAVNINKRSREGFGKEDEMQEFKPVKEGKVREEQDDKDEAEDERAMAPDMTVYDRDGKEVHLSDYIGNPYPCSSINADAFSTVSLDPSVILIIKNCTSSPSS